MTRPPGVLEERCAVALQRHLLAGDEASLHEAYEFGRAALAEGVGIVELAQMLWQAGLAARRAPAQVADVAAARVESFVLECFSPYEMAHRGARDANAALRDLDEHREALLRRIARELHDQAGQLLASVHIALEGLRPHLDEAGLQRLGRADTLFHQVEEAIRRISHELRPTILDDLGLVPALRFLAEGVARRSGLRITVNGIPAGRLPPTMETAFYRAAQEALANVTRHACATRVELEIHQSDYAASLRIRDDGRGFDPAAPPLPGRQRGSGLDGMRERVAPLGGEVRIYSRPGSGTELVIRIPMEESHAQAHSGRG